MGCSPSSPRLAATWAASSQKRYKLHRPNAIPGPQGCSGIRAVTPAGRRLIPFAVVVPPGDVVFAAFLFEREVRPPGFSCQQSTEGLFLSFGGL